jgi:hypothetical protein
MTIPGVGTNMNGAGVAQTISAAWLRRLDTHLVVVATVILAAIVFIAASVLGRPGIQTVDTSAGRAFPCTGGQGDGRRRSGHLR